VRLAALVLILLDALLAVPVWLAAYELQSILGRWNTMGWEGYPRSSAMVIGIFATLVWIGLHSLMGLYPGDTLSPKERFRRHRYSVVGAAAAVFIAMVLGFGDMAARMGPFRFYANLPRILLVLGFVGLLLLSPLVQSLARWGMGRLGIWDSPVNDGQ
jgi:hypothetical protein